MPTRSVPVFWLSPADQGGAPRVPPAAFAAPRCDAPQLSGDPATVARVLQALRSVGDLEHGHNIVDGRHIAALDVGDDSAELALSFRPGCGLPQRLADAAFQVLRRELPARDLFVTHPA